MNPILFQMNSVTAPSQKTVEPVRQIRNYFNLLKNMGRLGLQLVIERKYGLNYFDGIVNDEKAAAVYDDIVACVMHPEQSDSTYFHPEEIDAIAETMTNGKLTVPRMTSFLKTLIASRLEREALEIACDGDTHMPSLNWVPVIAEIEARPNA